MIGRRTFLRHTAGALAFGWVPFRSWTQLVFPGAAITVYKSKSCGCCTTWVDYVREAGFTPTVYDEEDMDSIKDTLGVPSELRSCHTAVLDRYLVEGHVPAADLRRLLKQKPKIQGLAVPGMPPASPGMAPPGAPIQGFEVVAFTSQGGRSTFTSY